MNQPVKALPASLKIGWASGALGVALLMNGVSGMVLFYMVSILKIPPELAGTLVFVTKIFDVLTDPLVGGFSDRVQTRWGRRRPFLLVGAVISALSFAAIYATPAFDSVAYSATYIFIAMAVYTVGYTVFNVPYMTMPAEMTDDYHERSSIHAYRIWFFALGQLIATSGTNVALEWMGKTEWSSWAWMGTVCAAIIFASMLGAFLGTKGARQSRSVVTTGYFDDIRNVLKNRYFLRLLAVKFCQLLGVASMGSAMFFFVINVLQMRLDVFAIFGVAITGAMFVGTPVLLKFSRLYGKREAYYVAALMNAVYALSWIGADPDMGITGLLWRAAIVGLAASGNVMLAMSMLTDIINFDAHRTGVRREGSFVAFYSFVEKFTGAFGPLIVGFALALAGFNQDLPADAAQSPAVRQALLLGMAYLPFAMNLMAIWILSGYRLTQSEIDGETVPRALTSERAGGLRSQSDPRQGWMLLLLLSIASSVSPFGMVVVVPTLHEVAQRYAVDAGTTQYLISAYLFGLGVAQPVCGSLADRFGRRVVMLTGFAVFAIASFLCAFVESIEVLIALRFAQAAGVSVGTVGSRAIVRDTHDAEGTVRALAFIATAMGVAPMIAPALGRGGQRRIWVILGVLADSRGGRSRNGRAVWPAS